MADHTPGPWHAGCFTNPETSCDCRSILSLGYAGSIATVSVDNGLKIVDGGNDSPPLAEAIANARLIAAAPELFASMQQLLDDLVESHADEVENEHHGDDPESCMYCRHIAEAEAVMLKVNGGE